MARQKSVTPATIFATTLRSALEHTADARWLGRHSPLATPYFLGQRSPGAAYPIAERERGLWLQAAIRRAADELWGGSLPQSRADLEAAVDAERAERGSKSSRYHYMLLELRYLRRHFPPSAFPATVEAMPGYLNVSPTRFFVHLDEAIEALGRRLLDHLNPALRLERPALVRPPVGRATTVATALTDLRAGRSVAITGPGGVGKTTVGAAIIAEWPGEVFWHTFHPGLNDDLNSLLFGFGHFAREAGAPTLWAQLLASEGRGVPPVQAIGMLRVDLETLTGRWPLLCFDEVDLLQTASGDPRRKQHAQVLELLDSLRGLVPILLIGQRVYVDTEAHFALQSLPVAETDELLRQMGLETDAATLRRVQQYTEGNPRLLELFAALRHTGEEAGEVFRLSREPSAGPLFSRLWRRLEEPARNILATLSVYRSAVPHELWAGDKAALADLIDRGLVKIDTAGGIALLPFTRELVRNALSDASRERLHRDAAHVRARYGDNTAAAYHYVAAGKPVEAVEIWFAHQDEEIMAGKAAAADEIFRHIQPEHLEGARSTELLVIRNRLALLAGESERVLAGMEGFRWDVDDEITAEALGQWAFAYQLRDQPERALEKYDEALGMISRATTKIADWRRRRGFVYTLESDLIAARREATIAKADIERLEGMIEFLAGRFDSARDHYLASLRLAELASDPTKIAEAHEGLSHTAGRQGHMDEAQAYGEKAMSYYAEIGHRLQLEHMRAELAGMYLNVRQFEAAIEPSEKALLFFELIKHERWIAAISTNLAEAYMETNRLDEARSMAFRALRTEIPTARPYALYTLGHLHAREGSPAHAAASFREGIEVARTNSDPFIEAYLRRALGVLLGGNGQTIEGRQHLETALRLFTDMGLEHEIRPTNEALREM